MSEQRSEETLGDKALKLVDSDDPRDLQRAQVYATLALVEQVHEHGRLLGKIGKLYEERRS